MLTCPGNHDYGPLGIIESRKCITRFKKYICEEVDYPFVYETDNCAFIMQDSMEQEMIEYEKWGAQGNWGKDQLQELSRLLNTISEENSGCPPSPPFLL